MQMYSIMHTVKSITYDLLFTTTISVIVNDQFSTNLLKEAIIIFVNSKDKVLTGYIFPQWKKENFQFRKILNFVAVRFL